MLSKTSIKCLVFATTLAFSLADKFERGDIVRVIQGNESGRDGKVLNRVPKRRSKGEKYCVEFADLKHSHQSNRRNTWKRIYAASNLNIVKKASQQVVKDEPASVIPARKTFVEDTWTHHRARNPRNSKPVGQNLEFESVLFHPLMNSPITPSSTLTNPKVESPVESVGFVFEPKKIRNALDAIATEKTSVLQKAKGWWYGSDSNKPKAPVQVEMVAITSKCKCLESVNAAKFRKDMENKSLYLKTGACTNSPYSKKRLKMASYQRSKRGESKNQDRKSGHVYVETADSSTKLGKTSFHIVNLQCESCYNKKRRRLMNRMVRLEQAMF